MLPCRKEMDDRLATPLGTEGNILVSEELLMVQDNIRSIGKNMNTLLIELDRQAFEAYMSSGSEGLHQAAHEEPLGSRAPCTLLRAQSSLALPNRVSKLLKIPAVTSHRWLGG